MSLFTERLLSGPGKARVLRLRQSTGQILWMNRPASLHAPGEALGEDKEGEEATREHVWHLALRSVLMSL